MNKVELKSDEEAAKDALKKAYSNWRISLGHTGDGYSGFQAGWLAGCQHVRSQQQPIKLGDKTITQAQFNAMYQQYSEMLTNEEAMGWYAEQGNLALKQLEELKSQQQQKDELLKQMAKNIKDIVNYGDDFNYYDNKVLAELLTEYNNLTK